MSAQPLPQLLAPRIPKVIEALTTGGRFPAAPGDWSMTGNETVPRWFRRVVDALPDKLRSAEVDRGLALFCVVDQHGTSIRKASLTAVVPPHAPIGELLKASPKHMYLRADFHPDSLGKPFREPLPHIHLAGDKEPRVKLDSMETGNLVADFIDFLYRTWFPNSWSVGRARSGGDGGPCTTWLSPIRMTSSGKPTIRGTRRFSGGNTRVNSPG